jgi:hypothetical protein
MFRTRAFVLPLLAIATISALVITAGCQSGYTLKTPYVPTSQADTTGPHYLHNVSQIKFYDRITTSNTATGFAWWDSTGKVRELNEFYDKVVVLTFFGTWSESSHRQLDEIDQSRSYGADTNVMYLAVSQKEGITGGRAVERIDSFARARKIDYQVLIGSRDFGFTYGGIDAVPTTFIITRKRRISDTYEGLVNSAALLAGIGKAEAKP